MNHDYKNYKTSQKQIRSFAWKVWKRARAAGAQTMQMDDIVSECTVAWVLAVNAYNPDLGVPFGPYLQRGMINHINFWLQKEINAAPALSLDQDCSDDESGDSIQNRFRIEEVSVEEKLGADQHRARLLKKMSPRCKKFVELLDNPPVEVVREFNALRARQQFAKERGISSMAPNSITAPIIFEIMDANNVERRTIYNELKGLTERISQ